MKRIISLILVALMLIGLVACGTENSGVITFGSKTINEIILNENPEKTYIGKKDNPNLIKGYVFEFYKEYEDKYSTINNTLGKRNDIFNETISGEWTSDPLEGYAKEGILTRVVLSIWKDGTTMYQVMRYDGETIIHGYTYSYK